MTVQDIQRKIMSYAHTELNRPEYVDIQHISKSVLLGQDVFRRNIDIRIVPVDSAEHGFPPLFAKFHEEIVSLQSA
jgi:hypothetical protein